MRWRKPCACWADNAEHGGATVWEASARRVLPFGRGTAAPASPGRSGKKKRPALCGVPRLRGGAVPGSYGKGKPPDARFLAQAEMGLLYHEHHHVRHRASVARAVSDVSDAVRHFLFHAGFSRAGQFRHPAGRRYRFFLFFPSLSHLQDRALYACLRGGGADGLRNLALSVPAGGVRGPGAGHGAVCGVGRPDRGADQPRHRGHSVRKPGPRGQQTALRVRLGRRGLYPVCDAVPVRVWQYALAVSGACVRAGAGHVGRAVFARGGACHQNARTRLRRGADAAGPGRLAVRAGHFSGRCVGMRDVPVELELSGTGAGHGKDMGGRFRRRAVCGDAGVGADAVCKARPPCGARVVCRRGRRRAVLSDGRPSPCPSSG